MEQGTDKRVESQDEGSKIIWRGPYKGKTCFVQRANRIKIRVETGFDTARVADFEMSDFNYRDGEDRLVPDVMDAVKQALIVLIGGHTVAVAQVGEMAYGVYPAKIYTPCKHPPEGVEALEFAGKTWINIGAYLEGCREKGGINVDSVKEDRDRWRDER